jgi:soluble lytic murein transglycosylase-like protein
VPLPPQRPAAYPGSPVKQEVELVAAEPTAEMLFVVSKAEDDYAEPGFALIEHTLFIKSPPVPPRRPAQYCARVVELTEPEADTDSPPFLEKVNRAPGAGHYSTAYDGMIADFAVLHGVPESFVHRVVMRESRYNPRAMHNHCFGLLQLKYQTARDMGYDGPPEGLLDPIVNLTYGIPYVANAYMLSGGNERRAIALYSAGYYYTAKHMNKLHDLRTASSKPATSGLAAKVYQTSSADPASASGLRPQISEVSYR